MRSVYPFTHKVAFTALIIFASAASQAGLLNGSFESGLTSWSSAGDAISIGNQLAINPTDGTKMALVATQTDGTVNTAVPAGAGVTPGMLNTALQLSSTALSSVGNGPAIVGSAVYQSITVTAGQQLFFDWDFMTNQAYNDGTSASVKPDAGNNDFAFFTANKSGSTGVVTKLADVFDGFVNDNSAPGGFKTNLKITDPSNPFIAHLGFRTTTWTAPSDGTYIFGIGVMHAVSGNDNGVNSAILVDNVRAVPEPASLLVLGIGALGVAIRQRRGVAA